MISLLLSQPINSIHLIFSHCLAEEGVGKQLAKFNPPQYIFREIKNNQNETTKLNSIFAAEIFFTLYLIPKFVCKDNIK